MLRPDFQFHNTTHTSSITTHSIYRTCQILCKMNHSCQNYVVTTHSLNQGMAGGQKSMFFPWSRRAKQKMTKDEYLTTKKKPHRSKDKTTWAKHTKLNKPGSNKNYNNQGSHTEGGEKDHGLLTARQKQTETHQNTWEGKGQKRVSKRRKKTKILTNTLHWEDRHVAKKNRTRTNHHRGPLLLSHKRSPGTHHPFLFACGWQAEGGQLRIGGKGWSPGGITRAHRHTHTGAQIYRPSAVTIYTFSKTTPCYHTHFSFDLILFEPVKCQCLTKL